MHARYALLAVILIQTLCASIAGARGSAIKRDAYEMNRKLFK